MKILANVFRIICGLVFLFSSFVKAVDPLGFAYQIEDYFIAFHQSWAIPLALVVSIAMVTLEFTVGAMLLLKLRMKFTAWILLLMMMFFTLLTLNDAIYEIVPDCGCFGEAIKLTSWQTFYKNIPLLLFAIVIFIYRNRFVNRLKPFTQWIIAILFAVLFAGFSIYNYRHLPLIDFTEWKVGNKLYAENPKPVKFYLTYKNKQTGKTQEFLSSQMPYSDSIWLAQHKFVSQRVEDSNFYAGKMLLIYDTAGNDVTQSVKLNPEYQLLINAYDLESANVSVFLMLDEFAKKAYDSQVSTAVLVSADTQGIQNFVTKNKLKNLDFYTADDIVLKTMVRANPGMMLLKNGQIIKKWHWRDIPDFEKFKVKYIK